MWHCKATPPYSTPGPTTGTSATESSSIFLQPPMSLQNTPERRSRVRFRGSFVIRDRNTCSSLTGSPNLGMVPGTPTLGGSFRRLAKLRRGGSLKEF